VSRYIGINVSNILKNIQDLLSKKAKGLKRKFFNKKESAGPSTFTFLVRV
jgi:hypothetical protein